MRQREEWGTGYDSKRFPEGPISDAAPSLSVYVSAYGILKADRL